MGPSFLYNRTKLAQVLTARALARRLDDGELGFEKFNNPGSKRPVLVNATHPGAVSTDQQDQAVEAYGLPGKIGVKAVRPFMKDAVKEGCRSMLWAATREEVEREGVRGAYIVPDKKVVEPSDRAKDVALGERLWNLSLGILKEKLVGKSRLRFKV